MKMTKIAITIVIVLTAILASAAVSHAQTKLEDKGGLLGRLIGDWVSTMDDGRTFSLSLKWGLNKHVVISSFDIAGQYSGFGLTCHDPTKAKIVHTGIDSIGGLTRGFCQVDDDKAMWKINYVGPNSERCNMAVVYTPVGAERLKIEYYDMDENGEFAGQPQSTKNFQRKPRKNAEKDKTEKKLSADSSEYTALSSLVDTGGFNWIIGNWLTTTNEGQTFDVAYKWGMGRNLIKMTFKSGEYEGLAMIFYAPQDGRVMQLGVDNRGGVTRGSWDAEGDKPVATLEFATLDGNSGKIDVVHTNIDAETMEASFYGIDESTGRSAEPWATLKYKRQAKQ